MNRENISGWMALAIAVIAAIPSTITALAAYNKVADTHDLVNSRMTEMLKIVAAEAAAKATLKEKAAEEVRETAAQTKDKP